MAKQTLGIRLDPEVIDKLKIEAGKKGTTLSDLAVERLTVNDHYIVEKESKIQELQAKNEDLEKMVERITGKKIPRRRSVTVSLTEAEHLQLVQMAKDGHMPKSQAFRMMAFRNQTPMLA